MVELLLHTWIEIVVEFFINYKPILQKIKDLLKLNFKTNLAVFKI